MFYCDDCGRKKDWPVDTLTQSWGPCEICHSTKRCNDVPTSRLPKPRQGVIKRIVKELFDA